MYTTEAVDVKQPAKFTDAQLEQLAKVLSECDVRSVLNRNRHKTQRKAPSNRPIKHVAIYKAMHRWQEVDGTCQLVLNFVKLVLEPVSYVNDPDKFYDIRQKVNKVLVFAGRLYNEKGGFTKVEPETTIAGAIAKAGDMPVNFQTREFHEKVLQYIDFRDLERNVFQIVFEAIKGISVRIRQESGESGDGEKLANKVFSSANPILAINPKGDKVDKQEQDGFMLILKGLYKTVRNPMAHEPSDQWGGEALAADYLSLISLIHRKLDTAVRRR